MVQHSIWENSFPYTLTNSSAAAGWPPTPLTLFEELEHAGLLDLLSRGIGNRR